MIYLQRCCCCVDLRIGTVVIGFVHILLDIIGGTVTALFGETGFPDVCHRLYIIFTMIHILSCVFLIIGSFRLRSSWMLFYILLTMVQILALVILIVADVILRIWFWVPLVNFFLIPIFIYFWLVAYSFYAALGGALFI
ncbi:hypothetical protein KR054_008497 [Drosophila jambulina]|nr:hypothetical protein KR054_008497 [Drosophila jambulina]